MKKLILLSAMMLVGMVTAQAQTKISLKGDAYIIKKDKFVALEVGGKIVLDFDEEFTDISSPDGKFFIAYDGEDYYLYDRTGEEVFVGGWTIFDKLSIVDGTIVATRKGQTKYYSVNDPETEIKVQQAGADFFDKGRDFNPEKMTRDKASAEAERLSALVPPENRFEIRKRANSNWQEIVVHGKVVHDAQEYTVLSDEEWFKENEFWVLVAKFNNQYGVVAINAYADKETGERKGYAVQLVPYEYTWAANHDGTGPMISCSTRSGVPKYFNYFGWNFELDGRTGKYNGTKKRWVYDDATEKWTFRAAAEGEELRYAKCLPDKAPGKKAYTTKW